MDHLTVLNRIDFKISRGDKVAFVGRNGEGKTTFSKIIIGELDYTGNLKTGWWEELSTRPCDSQAGGHSRWRAGDHRLRVEF